MSPQVRVLLSHPQPAEHLAPMVHGAQQAFECFVERLAR
jgi:hypothetical protein